MRAENEIRIMIETIEEVYPDNENEPIGWNPLKAYQIGILAGLKTAIGEYPSFAEIDLEEFMRFQFNECE